jgi:hypothetical protein
MSFGSIISRLFPTRARGAHGRRRSQYGFANQLFTAEDMP